VKRTTHLFWQVASFDRLCRAARKASKGKTLSTDALMFILDLEPAVLTLQRQLNEGTYCPGLYRTFRIRDPKPRTISAAPFRDRVVHHALCAAMEPRLEAYAIYDSYACRKGKGQKAALKRCQSYATTYGYFAKLDVRHFFETADHDVLVLLLHRLFKDPALLALAERFIRNGDGASGSGCGLPIGNLTSQHFANLYLGPLDHYVKEVLGVAGYLRYMDDMLFFGDDPQSLQKQVEAVKAFAARRLRLEMRKDAERFDVSLSGVPFLGFRIWPGLIRFDRARRRRFLRKMKSVQSDQGFDDSTASIRAMTSLCGWADLGQTRGLRRRFLESHKTAVPKID
jgi:RNA-directed DNA polymerase